jgi:hypothetical protein
VDCLPLRGGTKRCITGLLIVNGSGAFRGVLVPPVPAGCGRWKAILPLPSAKMASVTSLVIADGLASDSEV